MRDVLIPHRLSHLERCRAPLGLGMDVGAHVKQQVHGLGAAAFDGEMQRPVPFHILALDVHAARPREQGDHVAVTFDGGHMERRQAILVAPAEAGALAEEELEALEVASPRGGHD